MRDLVSVIIPVYNAHDTIECCVKSVLSQSYHEIEVIVVDDGSTDDCCSLLSDIQDKRLRIFRKENGGAASARNYGLNVATGKFVEFVDSDDLLEQQCIEKFVEKQKLHDSDLVISGYHLLKGNKKVTIPEEYLEGAEIIKHKFVDLWNTSYINVPWNKLYRKSLCQNLKFDNKVTLGEDLIFNINYLKRTKNIQICDFALYAYNVGSESSLTAKYYDSCFEDVKKIYATVSDFMGTKIWSCDSNRASEILWKSYLHCVEALVLNSGKNYKEMNRILDEWRSESVFYSLYKYTHKTIKNYYFAKKSSHKIREILMFEKLTSATKKYIKGRMKVFMSGE